MASLSSKKSELEQSIVKNTTTADINGTAAEKRNAMGGFDCEFVSIPAKGIQWECSVCLQVLREPYQAPCCGNSFCRVCIEAIKTDNKPCPTCNEKNFPTFHNKGLQRSLYEFQVYCSHKKEGCVWMGLLGELESHLNTTPTPDQQLEGCEYSETECAYCSETMKRCGVAVHQADHCPKRPFSCMYCNSYESCYDDVVKHYSECSSNPKSTTGQNSILVDTTTNGKEVPSHTDSQAPNETNTSSSPQTGNQQPPPPPPGGINLPPQQQDPSPHQQDDPVPPEKPLIRDERHPQDPVLQPAKVNNEASPVPVVHRKDNPNQHGNWRTTFCFGMCAGLVLPVLLGVLIYFHIQADKCGFMQSLVGKCEHHCNTTPLLYECHCDSGYTLNGNKRKCDDINECVDKTHNCTHKCVNTNGSFTCQCHDGYSQHIDPETHKIICEDINECAKETHECTQLCINLVGSYQCACRKGYILDDSDGLTCKDVDECIDLELCPQICRNTDGSYKCDCFNGYTLKEDQVNCRDVDECKTGKHNCVHNCHNSDGSYQCSCRSGYTLNKDGFHCDDIDECASSDTNRCEQICHNIEGSYECLCHQGYLESDDDKFRCDDVNECAKTIHRCTKEHAKCNNTVGSYNCYCDPGYRLMEDGVTCKDIDECKEMIDKCEHLCTNTDGSYTCRCYSRGHFYLNDDGFSCDGWLDRLKANPDTMKELWFQEMWDSSSSLDILMTGKTGSGKSTLVNGLVGEKVITTKENSLSHDTTEVTSYSRIVHNVSMRIWDSPGLQDRTGNEKEYIKQMKEKCHSVDLVLYCIKMDDNRLYDDDSDAISVLKNAFGRQFWNRTFFILTHANKVEPPRARQDDVEGYFNERLAAFSEELHNLLTKLGIHIKKEHFAKRVIPAGFEEPHLPGRRYWLSLLWHNVLEEADERAQGSMLKMGLERMINETKAENYEFEDQDIDEQPIVSKGTWWQTLQGWVKGE